MASSRRRERKISARRSCKLALVWGSVVGRTPLSFSNTSAARLPVAASAADRESAKLLQMTQLRPLIQSVAMTVLYRTR